MSATHEDPIDAALGDRCSHCGDLPELMELPVPAELSYTGAARQKMVHIDRCIVPLIEALNKSGCPTVACCCGHGRGMSVISLKDGTQMLVLPDWDSGRKAEQVLRDSGYFK